MSVTSIEVALLAAVVVLALVGVVTLYKVIRVHLKLFALSDRITKETGAIYTQIEALMALDKLLSLSQPLPPLRAWAASPDFLLMLAEHVLDARPRCVLECSSGTSTIVIARCLQKLGAGHVYSLEHSARYASVTRNDLRKHGLESWGTVLDAPLESHPRFNRARWYSLEGLAAVEQPVDMLVVDGPPEDTGPLARLPALPALSSALSPNCVIFLDDADREDEQRVVQKWLAEFPTLQAERIACEKGCVKLSPKRT
jgi:predicted O-methyltransferase YrrM